MQSMHTPICKPMQTSMYFDGTVMYLILTKEGSIMLPLGGKIAAQQKMTQV